MEVEHINSATTGPDAKEGLVQTVIEVKAKKNKKWGVCLVYGLCTNIHALPNVESGKVFTSFDTEWSDALSFLQTRQL